MAEQKIKSIDIQIENLTKLKEIAIKEHDKTNRINAYEDKTKNKSIIAKILDCPDIEIFEHLVKNNKSKTKSFSISELVFIKALKSEDLVFASSLFLGGYVDQLDISYFIKMMILAINKRDGSRIKMLLIIKSIKCCIAKKYKFNHFINMKWDKISEYETDKYNLIALNDQSSFIDDPDHKAASSGFQGTSMHNFYSHNMDCLLKEIPLTISLEVFKFILKLYLLAIGGPYEFYLSYDNIFIPAKDITYDNCADSKPYKDISAFNKLVIKYISEGLQAKDYELIKFINSHVKFLTFGKVTQHCYVFYLLNQTMNAKLHSDMIKIFDLNMWLTMKPIGWVGINLKTVSLQFFTYYVEFIRNQRKAVSLLSYKNGFEPLIENWNTDDNNMMYYLTEINRLDLVQYMMETFDKYINERKWWCWEGRSKY